MNPPDNKMATLLGGVEVEVTKINFQTGEITSTEKVRVRLIPIKAYPDFAAAFSDDLRTVEMLTEKPAGWAEDLHPQSFLELLEKGEEINSSFFGSWFQKRVKKNQSMLGDKFEEAVAAQVSALKSSSPSSPIKQG